MPTESDTPPSAKIVLERPGSRAILNGYSKRLFPEETLFHRIARTICDAGCLPRKELLEAWEVAKRVRRKMRGGPVYDLAAGHGVLAAILLLLDDTSPTAVCVDKRRPASQRKVLDVLVARWPRLEGRVTFVEGRVEDVQPEPEALVVSIHACGRLTDRVLDISLAARCRVAVLPCCQDTKRCDLGPLKGWLEPTLAIDAGRATRLEAAGYAVTTQRISEAITPKNRLLMGQPPADDEG